MSKLAVTLAAVGALALGAPISPVNAWDESHNAKYEASNAAQMARVAMRAKFGVADLRPGQYLWDRDAGRPSDPHVVVSLSDQMAYLYDGDELVAVSTISSGKPGKDTPTGLFPILEKKVMHRSRKYDNAPMPHMQRLDTYGIALHAGALPGYPASRGCVRLPAPFAAKLFAVTRVGTEVRIAA